MSAKKIVYIRNMVCGRCVKAVQTALLNGQFPFETVGMGEVTFKRPLTEAEVNKLRELMLKEGFEVIDDRKTRIVENMKNVLRMLVLQPEKYNLRNFPEIISSELHQDYSHLSALFSEVEHITVERYFVLMKLERVKELLVYDEFTLSEIAYKLGYANVHHLSAQFKKITGITPTHYKRMVHKPRVGYDEVGKA